MGSKQPGLLPIYALYERRISVGLDKGFFMLYICRCET